MSGFRATRRLTGKFNDNNDSMDLSGPTFVDDIVNARASGKTLFTPTGLWVQRGNEPKPTSSDMITVVMKGYAELCVKLYPLNSPSIQASPVAWTLSSLVDICVNPARPYQTVKLTDYYDLQLISYGRGGSRVSSEGSIQGKEVGVIGGVGQYTIRTLRNSGLPEESFLAPTEGAPLDESQQVVVTKTMPNCNFVIQQRKNGRLVHVQPLDAFCTTEYFTITREMVAIVYSNFRAGKSAQEIARVEISPGSILCLQESQGRILPSVYSNVGLLSIPTEAEVQRHVSEIDQDQNMPFF